MSRLSTQVSTTRGAGAGSANRLIALLTAGGMFAVVGAVSPVALWVMVRDGPIAAAAALAALGLGALIWPRLGLGELPFRWSILAALGLGLGGLSLLALGLGVLGTLHRVFFLVLVIALAIYGLADVAQRMQQNARDATPVDSESKDPPHRRLNWLWLIVIPFGGLAMFAATMPPGTLWPAEGNGYDVLEYHLAAPREYFEAGRISHLPHNIYSDFPFNVEMLYLLTMILRGNAVAAALSAQMVNLILGGLAVAAVWLAGREVGRGCGLLAGLLAATCPFLVYLSGLAYVENGLIFFTAMALAALLHVTQPPSAVSHMDKPLRWLALAGAMGGLACGCKYIAGPMVLLPLVVAAAWTGRRRVGAWRAGGVCCVAGLLTFSPWLIKNAAATGNPLFPLGRGVFHERAGVWDDDGAARWAEGHLPAPEDRSLTRRLGRLGTEVIGNGLFGPIVALALAAGIIALAGRTRALGLEACWILILIPMVVWLGWTHLVGRFAVSLIPPCAVAVGHWLSPPLWHSRPRLWLIVLASAVLNLYLTREYFTNSRVFELARWRTTDGLDWFIGGQMPTHRHVPQLNAIVASGGRVLMVADARRFYLDRGVDYCVVFNRNPFAEAAATQSPKGLLDWLRRHGYTHVFMDWGEMRRLRGSRYGFWALIDASLFTRLNEAGLGHLEDFIITEDGAPYATLFRVP